MKLPRDLSGAELALLLHRSYRYDQIRQTGSHVRMRLRRRDGEVQLTIPLHRGLKIGTLSAILTDVATHVGTSREDVANTLFGS